jgi:hypothetical protein
LRHLYHKEVWVDRQGHRLSRDVVRLVSDLKVERRPS